MPRVSMVRKPISSSILSAFGPVVADFDLVEFGVFGRPETDGFRGEADGGAGVCVDRGLSRCVEFGDADGDGGASGGAFDVDVAFDEGVVGAAEVQVVVVDELRGDLDEGDVAGEAAVVPPIGLEGGDAVGDAGVVDGEDDEVVAVLEDAGEFAVERGEAALVLADFLGVDPDESAVVGGADVEEGAGAGFGGVLEVALVPDGAFVIEELGALGVPVAGDLECGGFGEVVVLRVAVGVEGGVHEEAVFAENLVEVVEAGGVLVDDDVPVAVEGGGGAVVDVDEEGRVGLGDDRCGEEECGEEQADLQHEGFSGDGERSFSLVSRGKALRRHNTSVFEQLLSDWASS